MAPLPSGSAPAKLMVQLVTDNFQQFQQIELFQLPLSVYSVYIILHHSAETIYYLHVLAINQCDLGHKLSSYSSW